jgi:RNA polymerase sigma factor (sigma-70 family)
MARGSVNLGPDRLINTMNTQDDAEAIIAAQQLLPAAGQETLKRPEASKPVEVPEELYGKYIGLIIHIAEPFAKKARELGDPFNPEEPDRLAPTMEEFVNAGWVGFMKALRKFDPGRGIKLSTYAWKYIRGHCLQLLADYKKSKVYHPVELDAPVDPDDQDAEEAKERAESVSTGDAEEGIAQELLRPDEALMRKEEAPFRQRARKKLMADIARSLSPKEHENLLLIFGLDGRLKLTYKEAAKKLGISERHSKRLKAQALVKLRNTMPRYQEFEDERDYRRPARKRYSAKHPSSLWDPPLGTPPPWVPPPDLLKKRRIK